MLKLSGLSVEYRGGIRAVRGASLECRPREISLIVGPNGAGKTTLLRGISGFLDGEDVKVSAVEAHLDGASFLGRPPDEMVARGVVLVPEREKIFVALTTRENLLLSGRHSLSTRMGRLVLELFPQLVARMSAKAGLLSGGERQMLAIGRALLLNPRVLLIDELSLGLAPGVAKALYAAIRSIVSETGILVVVVDEAVAIAAPVVDRAFVMRRGELGGGISPAELSSERAFDLIYG